MSAVLAPDEPTLLFRWTPPRRRARALILFIAGSAMLHAFCFYLFQIVYPATGASLVTPARVNFVSATTNDGRALLRWVDAEDPALTTATLGPPDRIWRTLPKPQHIPSYTTARTPLKELPPFTQDLRPPSPQPPGPVRSSTPAPAPMAKPPSTAIDFSDELRSLGVATIPSMKFSASTREQPQNARFRVAVDQYGVVRYAFPIESSGDEQLDEQARRALAQTRFPPRNIETPLGEKLTWGVATVGWGADVALPAASPGAASSR